MNVSTNDKENWSVDRSKWMSESKSMAAVARYISESLILRMSRSLQSVAVTMTGLDEWIFSLVYDYGPDDSAEIKSGVPGRRCVHSYVMIFHQRKKRKCFLFCCD